MSTPLQGSASLLAPYPVSGSDTILASTLFDVQPPFGAQCPRTLGTPNVHPPFKAQLPYWHTTQFPALIPSSLAHCSTSTPPFRAQRSRTLAHAQCPPPFRAPLSYWHTAQCPVLISSSLAHCSTSTPLSGLNVLGLLRTPNAHPPSGLSFTLPSVLL